MKNLFFNVLPEYTCHTYMYKNKFIHKYLMFKNHELKIASPNLRNTFILYYYEKTIIKKYLLFIR